MKKLSFFGKIIFWLNIVAALLLILSFILPYVSPKDYATLSLLSLTVSPLIVVNILFVVYWLVQLRRQMFLSITVLVVVYFYFNPFFEFSSEGDSAEFNKTLKILSYNVRLFNAYEDDSAETEMNVSNVISEILKEQEPDIVCIQEFYRKETVDFSDYQYKYIHFKDDDAKLGHAIYSKFPIVRSGAFDFKGTYNNTLYADVVKGNDTIRIYNLHLQSLGIRPQVSYLQEGNKERMRQRMGIAFKKQEEQLTQIIAHSKRSKYPMLLAGDFNNTPFSYVYRLTKDEFKDAFLERGNGLGTTFLFDSYPMRIDYIFTSSKFEVLNFETIKRSFSDHYPICAKVGWD